jgi:hypothetical protein
LIRSDFDEPPCWGQFLDHLERAGEARITVAAALDRAR